MRILWLVRGDLTRHPGGDTTQILRTAAALRQRGWEIRLCDEPRPDLAGCDLVHLFHLDRLWENLAHARRVRAAGRPAVLSPIYWPADEFDRGGRAGFQGWLARTFGSGVYQNLRLAQRHLLDCVQQRRVPCLDPRRFRFARAARELLETAAVLLPNSRAEQERIAARFGVERPAVVVPNAADGATYGPPAPGAPPRAGVLCVGRIEPRKNQLALIRALRGTGIPLTLVGQAGRFSRRYAARCRAAADGHVRFVGPQPPAGLCRFYQAARVHACPSWYETPGLVSLEAALCGCALVVTPGGCTREYFGAEAVYAQPDDPASLRAAVETALARGPAPALAARLARECTWERAAERTAEAYRLALSGAR